MSHLEQLAKEIAAQGSGRVYGIPGSGPSLRLLDHLAAAGGEFVTVHFEGCAPLMAAGEAAVLGSCGASLSIKGPGLANMVPGLAACRLDAHPVVAMCEAFPPGTPPHRAHKRLDHGALVSGACKASLKAGEDADFATAVELARTEKPGPVHLDFCGAPFPAEPGKLPPPPAHGDEPDLGAVMERLCRAERPVVVAGTLAVRTGLTKLLNALAIPVFSTAAAKGVVDETRPQAMGVFTGVGGELSAERIVLPQADVVLAIGLRHCEVLAASRLAPYAASVDPLGRAESGAFDFDAVFTLPQAGERLLEALAEKPAWTGQAGEVNGSLLRRLLPPDMPGGVMRAVWEHFGGDVRLVPDTGDFAIVAEHVWPVKRPTWHVSCAQGRYMGVGLPLALGAAMADAQVPTVLVCGDGGVGMYLAEAKLAVSRGLRLVILLVSDGSLGTIRRSARASGLHLAPALIPQPKWRGVFEAIGMPAFTASNADEVGEILSGWNGEGPIFIEAGFDPERYLTMCDGVRLG